jgi:hypothetical protein
VKISLHDAAESRSAAPPWRFAFTSEHIWGPDPLVPPEARTIAEWEPPAEIAPGVVRAVNVLFPPQAIAEASYGEELESHPLWLPVPDGGRTACVTVFLLEAGRPLTGVEGMVEVGRGQLSDERTVLIGAYSLPSDPTYAERSATDREKALAQLRQDDAALERARQGERGDLRGLVLGSFPDGSRNLVDVYIGDSGTL